MAAIRQIVMFNWVTADGFFAAPDGDLEWVVPDPGQVKAAAEAIPRFDTILFLEAQQYESGDIMLRSTRTK